MNDFKIENGDYVDARAITLTECRQLCDIAIEQGFERGEHAMFYHADGCDGKFIGFRGGQIFWSLINESENPNLGLNRNITSNFKKWLAIPKEDDDMWIPEVGEECECTWGNVEQFGWHRCFMQNNGCVFVLNENNLWNKINYKKRVGGSSEVKFRPIQSEEDKLVERMVNDASEHEPECDATFCRALVKENYRKIKPMTEDEFVDAAGDIGCTYKDMYRAGCRFLDV